MRTEVTTARNTRPFVEHMIIRKIRGATFVTEDRDEVELKPSKVNVIAGPNGSLKTSFLEALVHRLASPRLVTQQRRWTVTHLEDG